MGSTFRSSLLPVAAFFVILLGAALLVSQPAPPERVGPKADGSFLLNSGWRIRPAGQQVPVDTFPMRSVLSPDNKFLLVLHGGVRPASISVLSMADKREVSQVPVPGDAFLGLAFSPNGRFVYVGGGSTASVHEFAWNPSGALEWKRTFAKVQASEGAPAHQDFVGDVAVSPDSRLLYAAIIHRDMVAVINLQTGIVIERVKTGRRPYRLLLHPDGQSFFVSSWADGSVYHYRAETGQPLGVLRLGPHTTDMVWSSRKPETAEGQEWPYAGRLFVAAANTNRVFVVGVSNSQTMSQLETINVAMTPRQPLGMTPSALALSADQKRLYTVCSDANAVAIADIEETRSRMIGYVPTGWYPTAVQVQPDGTLAVLNGRGNGSLPNPQGPNPTRTVERQHVMSGEVQYVGTIQKGTVSFIEPFNQEQQERYSATVMQNSPYRDALLEQVPIPANNPVPGRPGQPSPIEHVIYIVKENRTYDQVLGDLKQGNGDLSLTLFPESISPNHHKLAREFVLFDNFYVSADVSADGHNWSTSAIANDYVQKMWPNSYGQRRKHYDYEGGEVAALPPAGYLWSNAKSAGITMRNYGWWSTNKPQPGPDGVQIEAVRDPTLAPVTNMRFRAFDLDYTDVDRAKAFLTELAEFEKTGSLPRLIFLRIGNDHTSGTAAGKITPQSAMADNDYALGMIVEGLSKSRFWPKTAIFVLEDDAQNGPDHVDSHRSPAYVLSPYTRRGIVDSTMYNTTSMLRTIELLLGLRPMTQFDAAARPMFAAFAEQPNPAPYTAEKPRVSLTDRNPAQNPTAARSARMDFSEADRIDDNEMNAILWLAIRKTPPPAPMRSFFSHEKGAEEEDER